jgi:beta-lactam-binding protein with PASTA domain
VTVAQPVAVTDPVTTNNKASATFTAPKATVIKTTPGSGSYTAGKSIKIVESSGPKPKKKTKKK